MRKIFAKNLIELAEKLDKSLYVVGGMVRNYLIDEYVSDDVDLAAGITVEELIPFLNESGFKVVAEYKRTGTVNFSDGVNRYEYTAFRKEKYLGGEHVPSVTEFTEDINEDALRRDFKCNAVYYDLKNDEYVDPLGGIEDIKNKVLDTVTLPDKVFSNDGLRLMRLARFSGELNFTPTEAVMEAAKKHAKNIKEISPERIYSELLRILHADEKYSFSDPQGHYTGLKILDKTTVLDGIFPELTDGRNMAQRADFHKYDVLKHSLRCVLYANKKVRLAALLHDVGKPFCKLRDGNSYEHPAEGANLAKEILTKLKAPKKLTDEVCALVLWHMYDFDCKTNENKLRRFFVAHYTILEKLLLLKQADFSACADDTSPAPTCVKWRKLLQKMQAEHAPLTLKELAISGNDLLMLEVPPYRIAEFLRRLLTHAVCFPKDNEKTRLLRLASGYLKEEKR